MKRVLILGCNEITKRLLVDLCNHKAYASDICLSSRQKSECDELRNLAASMGVRVTTSGIDMTNVEGAMMMVRIFAPDLVINLLPPELSLDAMSLAIKAKADYIDSTLFEVPELPSSTSLLSKQFRMFGEFHNTGKTAVCGAGFVPGAVNAIIRRAAKYDFSTIDYIDLIAVSGERKITKKGRVEIDDTLYSEDIKAPVVANKFGSGKKVFYIADGKVVEAEANSIEVKSSSGTKVYLDSSHMVTDLIKEIPDIPNIRYFKLGRKPTVEHVPPKDKIEYLEELGLLSNKPVKVGNVEVAPVDLLAAILPKQADQGESAPIEAKAKGTASYEIYITGKSKSDNRDFAKSYIITGDNELAYEKFEVSAFDELKGAALIAGVKLMCRDKWKKAGVFTPAAFDCDEYYKAFVTEGIKVSEGDGKPF